MQDIHDIRPPVQVGMDPIFLKAVLIALALMLLVGAVLLVYRYLRQKKVGTRHKPVDAAHAPSLPGGGPEPVESPG